MGNYICESACSSKETDTEQVLRPIPGFPSSRYDPTDIWDSNINLEIKTKGIYYD